MIRVQLSGRRDDRLDRLRAQLASPSIDVVGASPAIDDAFAADVDVVVSADGAMPAGGADDEPGPGLIVLGDEVSIARLAASGARAWGAVPAAVTGGELRAAVTAVAAGFLVVPAESAAALGRTLDDGSDGEAPAVEALTPRELDVLELASRGLSNRDIAAALGISEHTVKFHLASVYGKLGASSRTDAVRRGLRRGLIAI